MTSSVPGAPRLSYPLFAASGAGLETFRLIAAPLLELQDRNAWGRLVE